MGRIRGWEGGNIFLHTACLLRDVRGQQGRESFYCSLQLNVLEPSDSGADVGNLEHGFFGGRSALGTIKGEYITVSENEIEIVITDKPFIVSYKTIEHRVREYLN